MSAKEYLKNIYLGDGWWNLKRFWGRLEALGEQRDSQKRNYGSTKNWSSSSTHFLGLVGEMVFSLETGMMLDKKLKPSGDDGFDFIYEGKECDIKSTKYWEDPHLKQYPNPKKWCDYYFLAGIKIGYREAKIFGWASREEIESATLSNYGYGPQRSISYKDLHKGMPLFLPSLRNKFGIKEPLLEEV